MKENKAFVAIKAHLKNGHSQSHKHKGSNKRYNGTPARKKEHLSKLRVNM